jgi:hypothetical protein
VIVVAGFMGVQASPARFRPWLDVSSYAALSQIASSVNRDLPMMLDSDTELTTVGAGDGVLTYHYRLVHVGISDLDPDELVAELKPATLARACVNPQTRDGLLGQGVTMRFMYVDKHDVHVASFDVTPAACELHPGSRRAGLRAPVVT